MNALICEMLTDDLQAWVVMDKDGKLVAHVQILGKRGRSFANVFTYGRRSGVEDVQTKDVPGLSIWAALSGLKIDGHEMSDYGEVNIKGPHDRKAVAPLGYFMTNYDHVSGTFSHCYKEPGLSYLTALGYSVVPVL